MEPHSRFDLDAAIATWRADLARHPGPAPADLRELEAHLREAFAELTKAGLRDDEAFLIARRRIGAPAPVAAEFAKTTLPPMWRSRLFWATFLAVFGAFVAYLSQATPIYLATASLRINPPEVTPMRTGPASTTNALTPEMVNTYIQSMESRQVAELTEVFMSPNEVQAFLAPYIRDRSSPTKPGLVNLLMASRLIQPGRSAYTLTVSVEHPDPQIAATVADRLATAGIDFQNRQNVERAAKAVEFLENDYREQRMKVDTLHSQMTALTTQYGANKLPGDAQATYDQIAQQANNAEQLAGQMNMTIDSQKVQVLESANSFQFMASAKNQVIQTAPKSTLLLVGGFFTALLLAAVLTALVRLLSYTRRPPPPAESVS